MANEQQKSSDEIEKLIAVRRVTKVVKGGRVMRFSAVAVVGNGDGKVGMGTGKAREVPLAVQKAMEQARREAVKINLTGGTVYHERAGVIAPRAFTFSPPRPAPASSPAGRCARFSRRWACAMCWRKYRLDQSLQHFARRVVRAALDRIAGRHRLQARQADRRNRRPPQTFARSRLIAEAKMDF